MFFDVLLSETVSFRGPINKGKDREKQAKDCGRNEASDNGEEVRGKRRQDATTKGELGKKHTEKRERQIINERHINRAGSKRERVGTRIKR